MRAEFFCTTNTCRVNFEQLPDPFPSQSPPSGREQQKIGWGFPSCDQRRPLLLKVGGNSSYSRPAKWNHALLVTFAMAKAVTVFKVDVAGTKPGQFRDTATRCVKQFQDRPVASPPDVALLRRCKKCANFL
jgi:hypothetical protein